MFLVTALTDIISLPKKLLIFLVQQSMVLLKMSVMLHGVASCHGIVVGFKQQHFLLYISLIKHKILPYEQVSLSSSGLMCHLL